MHRKGYVKIRNTIESDRGFGRVVITGGAGFLGSHLCEALLTHGSHVVCLDNLSTGRRENVAHLFSDPRFEMLECDVSEGIYVSGPVDLVMHFASPASPPKYLRRPLETLQAGSFGTYHALCLARERGARFLLASTSEVYGDPLEHPQRESYWGNVNPIGPRAVYDEAKRFAETMTMTFGSTYDVSVRIARIFNSYGPRMDPYDGRAVPTFIRQVLSGAPLTINGDGTQTRSLSYVDDTIRGIIALAQGGYSLPVNIGSPEEVTVLEIAMAVKELSGSDVPVKFIDGVTDDPRRRRPETAVAHRELGWFPEVSLREGLSRTIEWFKHRYFAGTTGAAAPGASTARTVDLEWDQG